jgi:PAS domain-containing protein
MNHVIGRNCRFLQGPKTNPSSIRRIREALAAGKEHYETFLNYRRDGSPFMNLLMMAPLYDSRGTVRYFIGAQVDVSGLLKEASGLRGLERLLQEQEAFAEMHVHAPELNEEDTHQDKKPDEDEFRYLTEMFNAAELEAVRTHGGDMYRIKQDDPSQGRDGAGAAGGSHNWNRPRILIKDESWSSRSTPVSPTISSGRLAGVVSAPQDETLLLLHTSCLTPNPAPWLTLSNIVHTLPLGPALPQSSHPVCLSITACSGYPAISLPQQDRRLGPRARRDHAGPRQRAGRHGKDSMDGQDRGSISRRPPALDTLHPPRGQQRRCRSVDGSPGRRGH